MWFVGLMMVCHATPFMEQAFKASVLQKQLTVCRVGSQQALEFGEFSWLESAVQVGFRQLRESGGIHELV